MKIKRGDLEKLSQTELATLVKKAQELELAQRSKTLDRYMETAHDDQIDFHQSQARIRYFIGGNRCLREDMLIDTKRGKVPICEISDSDEVLSYHEYPGSLLYSATSSSFVKAKGPLVRVIYGEEQFVSSPNHNILCLDGVYRDVVTASTQGHKPLSKAIAQEIEDFSSALIDGILSYVPIDGRIESIALDSLFGYPFLLHSYGGQFLYEEAFDRDIFRKPNGVGILGFPDILRVCIRSFLLHHLSTGNDPFHERFSLFEEDRGLDSIFGRIFSGNPQCQQFLGIFSHHQRDALSFLYRTFSYAVHQSTAIPVILQEEKPDWYWDITVPFTHNYSSNGLIHHNSGKTTAGVVESLWCLLGRHPFRKMKLPVKGVVVVQDFENHAKNILEPKFLQWAPSSSILKVERNQNGAWRKVHFSGGSTLDVLSHDQDIKVFEGGDYDFVHADEPPPKPIFNALWRGLTDRGGFAFITATPLTSPWMFQEIKKSEAGDPLRWFRYVDTMKNAKNIGEGNLELGKKRIAEFAELLDPDEKEARLHGKFVHMQGLIFKEFDRSHHLIRDFEWPVSWPIVESIDPHPHKPWGISWIGIAENGAKILLRSGLFEGTIESIAEQILYERTLIRISGKNRPRIVRGLIDNYASVQLWQKSNTEPTAKRLSVREELENIIGPRSGGPRVEVAPKNVKGKIDLFKQWLHIGKDKKSDFYVFDIHENERFIYEIENYVWDTKRGGVIQGLKDQPLKKDDDILDSVLQMVLTYRNKLNEVKEPIRTRTANSWKV